jgi:protein-L-isoaspartate(D-aspartate) O-methyltransferase
MTQFEMERARMVRRQLARRGIRDHRVLDAMSSVPREQFVRPDLQRLAYQDSALPISSGQTISQPYIVALMAEALELRPEDRVLEIGTGSGYAAAVLSRLAREVHTVERLATLADSARECLDRLCYGNVTVHVGDGSLGLPEHAPYDAITVAAGGPSVPEPLQRQLADGGRLVVPVGPAASLQTLVRVRRTRRGFEEERLADVRFVPLVGKAGWNEGEG